MSLPGVKVGPLDPDSTSEFGQVAQRNSARQLIRLHRQMYPPQLLRALARPLDEAHTKAAHENLDAIGEHVAGLQRDNGDPLVPEGAEMVGAAVRGDRATGQVVTFSFRQPSGRIAKWFAPYTPEELPEVYELGREYARIREMRDRGVVAFDDGAAGSEIAQRQLRRARAENERLRSIIEGRSDESADAVTAAATDVPSDASQLEELEQLRRENAEQRERLAQFEALTGAQGGGLPTGGLEEELGGGGRPQAAAQEPPFEDYEDLKADQVVERLRSDETSPEDRQAILEYERSHANRKSVVSAAEQSLG